MAKECHNFYMIIPSFFLIDNIGWLRIWIFPDSLTPVIVPRKEILLVIKSLGISFAYWYCFVYKKKSLKINLREKAWVYNSLGVKKRRWKFIYLNNGVKSEKIIKRLYWTKYKLILSKITFLTKWYRFEIKMTPTQPVTIVNP